MDGVSPRSVLKAAVLCSGIVLVLFLVNPAGDVWVTGDDLDPQDAENLQWQIAVISVIGPVLAGLAAGVTVGRLDKKHYRPFMEGGLAGICGLILGLVLWVLLGFGVRGVDVVVPSLLLGLVFIVIGAGVVFLTAGAVARQIVW